MEVVSALYPVVDGFFNVAPATVYNCHTIDRNEHETK